MNSRHKGKGKRQSNGHGRQAVWGEKNAFVLEQPLELSAADVVAAAKGRGLTLSRQQVHNIRSLARRAALREFGRLSRTVRPAERRKREAEFKQLAKILGYQACEDLLFQVSRAVHALGLDD